jgi:ribosomal protein S12 methylthiotransferase accessory factor
LVAVGPAAELEVALENLPPDSRALLRVLRDGEDAGALADAAGLTPSGGADLLSALRESGALLSTERDADDEARPGSGLRSAIVDGAAAAGGQEVVWTAEEVLVLPDSLDAADRTAALNAFVAGIAPFGRLRAYAQLLHGSGDLVGDRPDPDQLTKRLAECQVEPGTIAVIQLAPNGQEWHLPADQLAELDARGAHRLGPIARLHRSEDFAAEGIPDLFFTVAEIAEADLGRPTAAIHRRVQGSGSREHSELAARAEGAERFALAAQRTEELRTAAFEDLEAAVDPASLWAFNARQLRERGQDPAHHGERVWSKAQTIAGELRWVPAELAGAQASQLIGPELPLTSSGLAAHTDHDLACAAALSELVERDAFMWTWIQRVSRERVTGVPADVAAWSEALARQGWTARWVNLTLELQPAILCCLVNDDGGLVLGAASRPEPADALRKATLEALVLALRFDPRAHAAVPVEQIRTPADHLVFHLDPSQASEHEFLFASHDLIELGDITGELPLLEALAAADIEPLLIDLTIPSSRPFHVVRAAAPGLAPLSFGWDSEPLGLELLARTRSRHDGKALGAALDLGEASAPCPHPFA